MSLMNFTRRSLLHGAAGFALASKLRGFAASSPLFEEVPASSSGISWIHENAISPERYLPETMGPGVAFLDYDNDGWMDIYLVNSGASDFWTPKTPVRNALYKNNRDGTFSDVTLKAGVAGGSFGMGVVVGDYDNDGWPDLLVSSVRDAPSSITTITMARLPTSPKRPVSLHKGGRPAASGSITTTMGVSIFFCANPCRLRQHT